MMNSDLKFDKDFFWSQAEPVQGSALKEVRKCMVIIPHPDDESLGCAGLISMLKAQGTQFKFILTTDGSASHRNSLKFSKDSLIAIRKRELLKVLDILGFGKDNLSCFDAQDSAMPAKGEPGFSDLVLKLASELNNFSPDFILVPYELDPHRDHRASWQLLMSALENGNAQRPLIWEYPIWLYQNAAQEDIPRLRNGELKSVKIRAYLEKKKACIYTHLSQTTALIDDDPTGFRLTEDMISNFIIDKEFYLERQKLNPKNSLPADYFETLYRHNEDPWQFGTSEYESEKYHHTLSAIPQGIYDNALEVGCSIGIFTKLIADRCKQLTAIDISPIALDKAKKRLDNQKHVAFLQAAIPDEFPDGSYDLIILSEVGYYLTLEDLFKTMQKIDRALTVDGVLVLVHWIHFVVDYPLSGDDVHETFRRLKYKNLKADRTQNYRLDVYQKI